MKRLLAGLLFLLSSIALASAQESPVVSRIVLIGDAGEIDPGQTAVIRHAAGKILKGKTTVLFLGDNIYPEGMAIEGSAEVKRTQEVIRSQFQPMRQMGAPVYFLPGNHDWDHSGPLGLQKIRAQGAFIAAQGDQSLQMVPKNGCPDPVVINISKDMAVVAFDSEWWLYPYHKKEDGIACGCRTKDDVVAKLAKIATENSGKILLLAAHHPFQSYGTHGGYYTLKQHLFPLTDLNKNLYVPLPVLGSLNPLIRTIFRTAEDLRHPVYREMIKRGDAAFNGQQNLIHVSGHDHGLQFIVDHNKYQVVSGSGAKHSHAVKGKYARYADARQGYVVADLLASKNVRFTYFVDTGAGVKETFTFVKRFTK
jgi:hypothetical protein